MGNALHRLEVLLVGLVLLLAGTVVAVLLLVRPASPSGYVQITPQPIGTSVAAQPTSAPVSAAAVATAIPIPTAAPAATSAPSTLAPTQITSTAAPSGALARTWSVPPILIASWPYLLLTVGLGGLALVGGRSIRRRRLPYINQSVGQLLALADPVTRATNVRVMQNLAAQGLLTGELAAAAGIDRPGRRLTFPFPQPRIPRPTLSALRLPTIKIPKLRLPTVQLPRRQPHPLTIDGAPVVPARGPAAQASSLGDRLPAIPTPGRDLGVASLGEATAPAVDAEAIRAALAAQVVEVLPIEPPTIIDRSRAENSDPWTAEDRVLALAGMLAEIWRAEELTSPILALDTASAPGNGQVMVTFEPHPNEEERIVALPERISAECPEWRASWRQDKLIVDVVSTIALPLLDAPPIVPLLTHGRGGKTTRFYPLTSWRHLALYGGQALHALHALLCSLLYNQPPSHVALAILDRGEISPLYRNVAHLVPLPGSPGETLEILAQAIRRGTREAVRPLVLVIVEPDDTELKLLMGIVARIRVRPSTPVHLLIVQEHLNRAGRELYAMLPALITSAGHGPAALLPGQGDWPRSGQARLVGHGMRVEGRPILIDEVDVAAQLAFLYDYPAALLPVLWDLQAVSTAVVVARQEQENEEEGEPLDEQGWLEEDDPSDADEAEPGEGTDEAPTDEPAAQQRRLALAVVAQRQRLIDAEDQIPRVSEYAPGNTSSDAQAPAHAQEPSTEPPGPASVHVHVALRISSLPLIVPTCKGGGPAGDGKHINDIDVPEEIVAATSSRMIASIHKPDDTAGSGMNTNDLGATDEVAAIAAQFAPVPNVDGVAQLEPNAPPLDAVSSSQTHEPVAAADLPGPSEDDPPKPPSRRAELLRRTLAAGRADAPQLHIMLPELKEPASVVNGTASSAAGRSPTDHPAEPQPIVEPENGWPIGPAPLGRVAMAELMARVASASAIIAGQANEQGVTKNRLVELLKGTHKALAKELAEVLMAWFDLAGLLVEPTRPGRLRHPRALTTLNLIEIAQKLNATPCPDKDTVRRMWADSNEGRN